MLNKSAARCCRPRIDSVAAGMASAHRVAFQPLEPRKLLFGDPVFDVSTVDGMNGVHIAGLETNGQFGFSVTALGDVNGDGVDDLAIGAPTAGGSFQEGKIYVLFGGASLGGAGEFDLNGLDGTNGFVITGIELGGNAGWSVSSAGDVNNDTRADILIGAPFANKAYILFGSAGIGGTGLFSLGNIGPGNGVEINGGPDDSLGLSVAGIGDLNKDGYGDVALASPLNINDSGVTYVIFGGASPGVDGPIDVLSLDGVSGLFIPGVNLGDQLGWRVSSAGDLNNDGVADLAMGAIESDIGAVGSVYVLFGAMNIGAQTMGRIDLSGLDGTNGFVVHGAGMNTYFGMSVSGGGDVNGDMIDDLIVGSITQKAYIIFGRASIGGSGVFDLGSLDGSNGYVATVLAGAYAAHAGDLNHDGIGDVAIASLGSDEVYVFVGGPGVGSSGTLDTSTVDGENGFIVQGVSMGSGILGQPVSAGKDVNDDGFDDLLIGASAANKTTGEAFALFGVSITGLSAPVNLVATPLDEMSIELQWHDTTLFEDGFEVERSLDGVTGWTLVTTTPPSSGTGGVVVYPDGSLAPDTEYFYRVRAYNGVANSAWSNVASATTQGVPAAPTNLQVGPLSDTELRLTWNDNSGNEQGFNVYRFEVETFIFIGSVGPGVTAFDDSGLDPGTEYAYVVRAFNDAGESDDSNIGLGTTDGGSISVPQAPTALTAMAISSSEIQLNWIDNSTNEDGFYIERALDPNGTWSQIDTVLPNQTQYVNMSLPADSTYFYRIRAYNSAGSSTPSNVAGATTSSMQGGGHSAQLVDSDGDMVTFTLVGVSGTITFTSNGDGGIDTLYVGTGQIGTGSLIVTIQQSMGGDGRVQIGQLQGDISSGDLYVRVASVNFGSVDIVGGGAWLCDVNRVVLGDLTGSASIQGRVADLTVRDVNTSGGIYLCDMSSFKARTLNLGGGFEAHSVSNFNVDTTSNFRLSLDGAQGLGSMRLGDDASVQLQVLRAGRINIVGDAQFIGSSLIDGNLSYLKIGGSWLSGSLTVGHLQGKVEVVGDAAGSATLNASGGCVVVCGNSAATLNLDHVVRFVVKGDVVGGAINTTDSGNSIICIMGDLSGGTISTDESGLWRLKVCGSFESGAGFQSDGDLHNATIRGDLNGTIDVESAFYVMVFGDFTGVFSAAGAEGEVVHKFCVKGAADGGRFFAAGDVNCVIVGAMNQAEVYVGLPMNWGGGLPSTLDDFVQQSTLRKLQVRGTTDGATIASASIANLCLREIAGTNPFRLAAGAVDHAKMIVENQAYNLGPNAIFTDLPMLSYLDILQLL